MRHRSHHHSSPFLPTSPSSPLGEHAGDADKTRLVGAPGSKRGCVRWGVWERMEPFQPAFPEVRATVRDSGTWSPFLLPGAEHKPIL